MKRVERFVLRAVGLFALVVFVSACAATSGPSYSDAKYVDPTYGSPSYDSQSSSPTYGGQAFGSGPTYGAPAFEGPRRPMPAAQGWFGIGNIEQRNLDIDSSQGHVDDVDEATTPVIGGAFMQPLGGSSRLSYGLEGGLSFAWSGDIDAVVVGSGGIAVAGSTDVFLGDLFGGPYIAFDLNPKVRLYGSTGLGLEWASFDLGFEDTAFGHQNVSGDAFGGAWYVRAGIEFRISPATWIGLGVRHVDSSVDPSGGISDVDLRQEQLLFTVTNGF